MTDENKPPSREEFQRLRNTVAAQSEVIENYLPDDPQKRKFLGEAAKGIGAVGALGIAGQSGYAIGNASAEASTSDSDVDIGSPNNRHDAFLEGVDANSVSTDEINNTVYASQFSGPTLADRVQAAINAGETNVRVAKSDSAYNWFTNIQPPVEFTLWFDDYYQPVTFEGSSGSGDSDIAIEPDRRLKLRGGWFETTRTSSWNTSDPWTWLKPPGAMTDSRVKVTNIRYFEEGVHLPGNDANAWNNFNLDRVQECHRGVLLNASTGYSNENRFRIGHGIYASGGHTDGTEVLFDNQNGSQNSIIDSDLGMANGTMLRVDDGGELRLHNVRFEDTTDNSTHIKTTANATNNPRIAIRMFGWNKAIDSEISAGKIDLNDPSDLVIYGDDMYGVYHQGQGKSLQAGSAMLQAQNDNPPALDTFADYVRFRTGSDSHYSFGGFVHIVAENSADIERRSTLYSAVAAQGSTTVTELATNQANGAGTMTVQIRYGSGDHFIEAAADSGSGWTAAPDSVTVTATGMGKNIRPSDQT